MKVPTFTLDPAVQNPAALKDHRVVSREEQTLARKAREMFRSRQDFIEWGKQYDNQKFTTGEYLADYLRSLSTKSLLGLGSGESYCEYAIKLAAPEIEITATDFDPFVVEKVSEFLPEIDKVEVFDFKRDDFTMFQGRYDTILMLHSEYVLSDDEMVDFFRRVASVGASHIIIVSASYLSFSKTLKCMVLLPLNKLKNVTPKGRFHGWARSKGEFVKFTRRAGVVRLQEVITGEPFVASQALLHIVPKTQSGQV